MAGLRRRQDALRAGKDRRRLKHLGLGEGTRLHIAVVVELGENRAHAVVAQAARVARGGDEAAAQGVHLRQRADLARVAEVIGKAAARKARAGGRLHRDEAVIPLAAQLLAHEGGNETAEVRAAARTAYDVVHICYRFQFQ